MTKVSVNNDPLRERLIFGYDGSDYRVISVNSDGELVAAVAIADPIEVIQDTAADLKATVTLAASQSIGVTQSDPTLLRAQVDSVPRIPEGVTDLSGKHSAGVANNYYVEMLSDTSGASFGACSGRTVASGKRLCLAWAWVDTVKTSAFVQIAIGYGSTILMQVTKSSPSAGFAPSVVYYMVGDGSKVWKVTGRNVTGVSTTCVISALIWEEDVP